MSLKKLFRKNSAEEPEKLPESAIPLLKLFNAVHVPHKEENYSSDEIHKRTIRHGYILHPSIEPTRPLLKAIEKTIGISGEKANAAFHKSWRTIQRSSTEKLIIQQVVHYITTYGYQELGIYSEDTIYIPAEVLELPYIKESLPLTTVKAMDTVEILEAVIKLGSGIALAKETLQNIMAVVKDNYFSSNFVEQIKNRELKVLLNDYYNIAPEEPLEYLRFLIRKLTGETLLIKNRELIGAIKEGDPELLDSLLAGAPDNLASIFFRFKPLFLAMRSISKNKTFFNRLRKRANRLHIPMKDDFLNSITELISNNRLDQNELEAKVDKYSIFRKVRLAYALNYRSNPGKSVLYRVRNGRGWVAKFNWPETLKENTAKALDTVLRSISSDISKNVEGKTIYIPPTINYALPATEKQFTGNFPSGSYVSVPDDIVAGIHWTNIDKNCIDLDLSLICESGKIGWDSDYKTEDNKVLFSGDMTSAPRPKGATELFYLKKGIEEAWIFYVNYYNFSSGDEVECKLLVANEMPDNFRKNYLVDVNNIVASATINITRCQNILGFLISIDGENRMYFTNVSIGNGFTAHCSSQGQMVRRYLVKSMVGSINLKDILVQAGTNVVETKPEEGEYIDLSPENLNKTTILDLLQTANHPSTLPPSTRASLRIHRSGQAANER